MTRITKYTLHNRLKKVCFGWEKYKKVGGPASIDLPDCSCGCRFFYEFIEGDWGVCICPESPRKGLLTFEHMGCLQFRGGELEISKKV